MAKQQQQRGAKIGKGKVTAVQVAFIVEQYLADNNYANALSAFRSDAADLFAKMKTKKSKSKEKEKEVPKGLMGLGEILDEYISLKEQKLLLQQDKARVENAMHSFHNLMRTYCQSSGSGSTSGSLLPVSTGTPSSPPDLIPPQFVAPNPPQSQPQPEPLIMPFLPHTVSPPPPAHTPGTLMNASQAMTTPSTSYTLTNFSTPITNSSYTPAYHNKRKASKSVPNALPAFKKPCIQLSSHPVSTGTIVSAAGNMQEKAQLVNNSIAKSLFKTGQPISNASPETPQPNKLIAPNENPSFNKTNSKCSIISSERIIVSPLKGGAAYYSVERSYQITSPLKPDGRKPGKRDHVKGKLNFDNTDVNAGPSETSVGPNDDKALSSTSTYSPSSSDGGENENQVGDGFDFDFLELDILNGDFSFSELLVDLDLDCDGVQSQSSPEQTNPIPRLNSEVEEGEMARIILPDSSKLPVLHSDDAGVPGGHESVTSFRAITKRVKIVSPVKAMRKQ
ncbi:uncharacterized protein LOC144550585 [Carex rostrata]